jgi:two-component system response regulator CssR
MLKDDVNGYDIIKEIRKQDELVPVIFTSARDQDLDKILGLELGSDDYITKPYSPKELVLRVNNIIKRVYGSNEQNIIKYDNYVINLDKRKVTQEDKDIKLTTLEFDLLVYLLNNKGKQLSREEILEKVWQENYFGSDRVVDDLIRRLRKKMHINVQSIYGYGYRLDE